MTSSRMLEMSALTCEFELSTFLSTLHELAEEFERELVIVVPQRIPSRHHLIKRCKHYNNFSSQVDSGIQRTNLSLRKVNFEATITCDETHTGFTAMSVT